MLTKDLSGVIILCPLYLLLMTYIETIVTSQRKTIVDFRMFNIELIHVSEVNSLC